MGGVVSVDDDSGTLGRFDLRHPAVALTSFVGRRRAVALLAAELRRSRLVTVTGPGGVGKTRTAFVVADLVAPPDGVRTALLASVTDASQVAPAVATALRVADQSNRHAIDRVIDHLRAQDCLLVLDNCEHQLEACASLVVRLLEALPVLRVLATSREPLGILGEQVHLLAPLAVPDELEASGDGSLEHVPAVQLLVDRARGVLPEFAVTPENRASVIALCRRLDGLPLAIELAAVRLRSLSVSQIVERLDRRFSLLSSTRRAADPRQRSLRTLIGWSHDLCSPQERLLWARLAVFPASVDLSTLEMVCGFGQLSDDGLLDALDGLVTKSIVVAERHGEGVRYNQLVTLREYGAELLSATGEADVLRRRHRDHLIERASAMVDRWCGPHQAADLAALRDDHPHLLAALSWSVATAGEAAAGARLASLLRYHWLAGGFVTYGRRWLERLLPLLEKESPARGEALWVAAWVALIQGDRVVARVHLDECAATAAELDDRALHARVAQWRALLNLFDGNLSAAIDLYNRCIDIHRVLGNRSSELTAMFMLAMAQTYAGRPREALGTCSMVIDRATTCGELWNRAYAHWVAGISHLHLGDLRSARTAIADSMRIELGFRDSVRTALCIEVLSWVTAAEGRSSEAAALSGIGASVWRRIGTSIEAFGPHASRDSGHYSAETEARLGRTQAARIRAEYTGVQVTEAARQALQMAVDPDGHIERHRAPVEVICEQPSGNVVAPLTAREREIAQLVARGMSNKAIAKSLTISPRTVDGHVESILRKLDFSSRTQIASWIAAGAVR